MTTWMLEGVEIEGFRGINNEGDPLVLRFKTDCVSSISAPNGVGKSSIFDAVSFAIRGTIPKLDGLPASERSDTYYINRFHRGGEGKIVLKLLPDNGAQIAITVERKADGARTVTSPAGIDGNAILAELDREFVLLDHKTFESFIDDKDLDRGRSFAGLLGLKKYSDLRQELQALSNTRAFNSHFSVPAVEQRRRTADADITKHQRAAEKAFEELTKKPLTDHPVPKNARDAAHSALEQIELLKPHCLGKQFGEIDFDGCVLTIKQAEGGEDRAKLAGLVRTQTEIEAAIADGLDDVACDALAALAAERDAALLAVGTALLRQHLQAAEKVLAETSWADKNLCPTCETHNDTSVLTKVQESLARYEVVEEIARQIASLWADRNWSSLVTLEKLALEGHETAVIAELDRRLPEHSLSASQVQELRDLRARYSDRLAARLAEVKKARDEVEKRLPPSLVAVTTSVEAARRLRESWSALATAQAVSAKAKSEQDRMARVKQFLDRAASTCATAESSASMRRLAAVQPVCETLFASIIHDPVKPALNKRPGSEDLALTLSKFWTLSDVSAQALLSESFRNAFAVSVYLAAAKLYGGSARFMLLDDVTSSFDAGHQFHLMEVIRTKFARPGQADGPQVILLSHDTLLEKLFNKNANGSGWQHVRLEGTARTAVLPQSSAGNRVKDATLRFLNAGQVEDGALRLRQYLEYKLLEIIGRVNIPVPIDFALDDTKKQVQSALDAIQAAVALHKAANTIVLTAPQQAGLQTHVASITGNFLAHYATGSTQAFSGSSLLGVVKAIDDYAECFMYEEPPGSGALRFYRSLSRR